MVPYVNLYKKQIAYYNHTTYKMLTNEKGMILPTIPKEKRHKRSIIGSIISSFIGLHTKGFLAFCITNAKKAVTLKKVVLKQYTESIILHLGMKEYLQESLIIGMDGICIRMALVTIQ